MESNEQTELTRKNGGRLIDGEQDDRFGERLGGWRNWAKRKKDSWMWTTVWWLLGGVGIMELNGKKVP